LRLSCWISWSAIASTAITSFSAMQTMLLSSDAPRTIASAAFSRFAVSSTTAGGLPGPAQIAFLPEFIACLTTAGPPVTTTMRTSGCFISVFALSIVGRSTLVITSRGPPADWIASFSRWTHQLHVCAALGCVLNTTALPAATMPIALLRIVSVGFVVGVIASITPYGARSVSIRPSSPVYATGRRISQPGVLRATSSFFESLSS